MQKKFMMYRLLSLLMLLPLLAAGAFAQTQIGTVVTGPGTFNLTAGGEYRGSVSLNLSAGQTVRIVGNGAHLRDEGLVSPDQIIVTGSGTLIVENLNIHSGGGKRGVHVNGSTRVEVKNSTFNGHTDGLWVFGNASTYLVENTQFLNVKTGILASDAGAGTVTGGRFVGPNKISDSKGMFIYQPRGPVTVSNVPEITGYSFGIQAIGVSTFSTLDVSNSTFVDNTNGIHYSQNEDLGTPRNMGTVTGCKFGSLSLPLDGTTTRGVFLSGTASITVITSTFERRTFGIHAINGPKLVANGNTFRECKNGVAGTSVDLDMGAHNGTQTLFENLITNDGTAPRGVLATKEASKPGSKVVLRAPMTFKNIWYPEVQNGIPQDPEFSHGEAVNILDSELTIVSTNPASFVFDTVGRAFVITNSHAHITHVSMKDVVRGVLYARAGTLEKRTVLQDSTLDSSGIHYDKRHDAMSATDSFLTIRRNTINMTGGGVICVASNDADIFDNNIQNTKRNSIAIQLSQRTHAGRNFCRTTIGNPALDHTGLDNIYIDRSQNVLIFDNRIMDSNDNGVFSEGSQVTIRNNFISGQANDGILLVQSETPGATEKTTVIAHDNTIVNYGNFGIKVLANQNILTAYRNIIGWTGAVAAPSQRSPAAWPDVKLGSGAEVVGNQKNLEIRDSVFFRNKRMGIDIAGASPTGGSDRFRFYNNAIVDSGTEAIKVMNSGSYTIFRGNFIDRNGLPSPVELYGSTAEFERNNFGSYYNPARRLFFTNTAFNVPNNYWGRPQGPGAGIVEGANPNPFLTQQTIFHTYNHAVVPSSDAVQWSGSVGPYTATLSMMTAGINGEPMVFSAQAHTEAPTNVPTTTNATAYLNLLVDQRVMLATSQVNVSIDVPVGSGTPSLLRLNSSNQWVAVGGVATSDVNGGTHKRLTAAMPKSDIQNWFAVTGGGTPPPDVLSSKWYFAEGATVEPFQTFVLMANPSSELRTVRMDLLLEGQPPVVRQFNLQPNSRRTIELNEHAPASGVSTVLTEINGKGFAAERAMYVKAPGGKWNAAHAAVGVTSTQPEWFFPEGATGNAGPAGRPFQTFILLANPTGTNLLADVTYFPEGAASFTERITILANSRLTLEPGKRFSALAATSFSTRVKSVNGTGILAERAMWWSDPDWTLNAFMGGHASPGLPSLSNTWYFGEGNTDGYDDFILFVNPGGTPANVDIDYLTTTAKVSRQFVLPPNSRQTVNVTWDSLGMGSPRGRHGTTIRSSQPIAVERSMYWTRGKFGWVDGHNSLAAPLPSTEWLLPEGATVPVTVGVLTTEILLANPGTQSAVIQLRFLLEGTEPVVHDVTLPGERSTTVRANDIPALASKGFATQVTSNVPIVVERSMYFNIDIPEAIEPVGGTCSMGIATAPAPPVGKSTDAPASSPDDWTTFEGGVAFPTSTPTPTVTPIAP